MQLTLFSDYSLRVLMYLGSKNHEISTVKEIADFYDISRNHLIKVVHKLSTLGYIESKKGKNGGIRLKVEPESITLREVIESLESDFKLVECFDKENNSCRITSSCSLKGALGAALESFLETLDSYTLKDIIPETPLVQLTR